MIHFQCLRIGWPSFKCCIFQKKEIQAHAPSWLKILDFSWGSSRWLEWDRRTGKINTIIEWCLLSNKKKSPVVGCWPTYNYNAKKCVWPVSTFNRTLTCLHIIIKYLPKCHIMWLSDDSPYLGINLFCKIHRNNHRKRDVFFFLSCAPLTLQNLFF